MASPRFFPSSTDITDLVRLEEEVNFVHAALNTRTRQLVLALAMPCEQFKGLSGHKWNQLDLMAVSSGVGYDVEARRREPTLSAIRN